MAALAVTFAYLTWRVTSTLDLSAWWVSIPLFLLEVHAFVGLALFTFSLWDLDGRGPATPRDKTDLRLAILIPTYNEPLDVLLPTVAAAVTLSPQHETWVLDDGSRPEVQSLARDLGAHYLTRPDHSDAKAGNVNHALGVVNADFIAVLDADHVAGPDFLTHTIGYFDDPRVAVVQTPQDFYNDHSFEHEDVHHLRKNGTRRYSEQALFYRVLQTGKNRWGAAFWCGTGAVVRAAALREVGGVATGTVTEDIHTTIRLHRKGWSTVYHNEVLARGLAASDAAQFQSQRLRWGTGAMQVLRRENPLWCRGLRLPQRLAYAATLMGWFDAWRSLGYLVVPMLVLATGAVPIQADPQTFAIAFGVTFALQRAALSLLARGRAPQILSTIFELVRMPANLLATLTLLSKRPRAFKVTPKGRTGDKRGRAHSPLLLMALLALSGASAVWFLLSATGRTAVTYEVPWAAYGALGWLVVNACLLVAAIARIRAERFAGERRDAIRFGTQRRGLLDGRPVWVKDLSIGGALIESPQTNGHARTPELSVEGLPLNLKATVRTRHPKDVDTAVIGLEFAPGQNLARGLLALALLDDYVTAGD